MGVAAISAVHCVIASTNTRSKNSSSGVTFCSVSTWWSGSATTLVCRMMPRPTTLTQLCQGSATLASKMDALTINEAAETTGWSPRMLRYVERLGPAFDG